MSSTQELLSLVRIEEPASRDVRLGTITSTSGTRPNVRFDGENTASSKGYPFIASYVPTVGDRVLLVRVGSTFTILGVLSDGSPAGHNHDADYSDINHTHVAADITDDIDADTLSGAAYTVSATEPSTPSVGDVWIDIS